MPRASRRWLVDTVFFALAEFAAILLLANSESAQDSWLDRASKNSMAAIGGWAESTRDYFTLRRQNDSLSRENMELSIRLRTLEEARLRDSVFAPGDRASGMGLYADDSVFRYIPATIVKVSRNSQRNYVVVNKGRADGVLPNSGIISTKGVVGIIESVDEHYSYGISLMNNKMRVSARIGRLGVAAPLEWDGRSSSSPVIKELPRHLELHPGDTVLTSGWSGIFPADIPLGVIGQEREVDGSVKEAEVRLFTDFAALRYVSIVENRHRDSIR